VAGQGFTYAVDIVLCIDVTGSMAPAIDLVKDHALKLHDDLVKALAEKDREVTELRIRVIAFRDVDYDTPAFQVSHWFSLPEEDTAFRRFVSELQADGGGDEPESALDALSIAFNSDWTANCMRQRHIVVLWTDATSKPPSGGAKGSVPDQLKGQMVDSLDRLSDLWNDPQSGALKPLAKRMILFAPDCKDWNDLSDWDEVIHYPSRAGNGLKEVDYNAIIGVLAESIASQP